MENNASSEGEANREFRCDPEQYAMLTRCSEKRDMTEWNNWRKTNPDVEISLDEADLEGAFLVQAHLEWANLRGANLSKALFYDSHLEYAKLDRANLEGAAMLFTHLKNADLLDARLCGASLHRSELEGASLEGADISGAYLGEADLRGAQFGGSDMRSAVFHLAKVSGETLLGGSPTRGTAEGSLDKITKVDRETDFTGVALDGARVEPGLKQSLRDNIRRIAWENWYRTGSWWMRFLKRLFVWPFWLISDHGRSTGRIIVVFFALAVCFAFIYWRCPNLVEGLRGTHDSQGYVHALYFSVVTMTTLGFGDVHANPENLCGQFSLIIQVILGYVLLGALVTRFAVLFSGEGPAREFAKKEKRKRAPKAQQKEDGAEEGAENSNP